MVKEQKKSPFKHRVQKVKAKFLATYYSNPAKDIKIIAVAGTVGREITAHYLHNIIKVLDEKAGLILEPTSTSDLYKQLFAHWKDGANYAVIDALGNAAFYEVGPYGYTKYDANDPQTAPGGVLIRTNYSLAGDLDRKVGEDRWKAAEIFVSEAMASQQFNWRYILQNLPRYLVHSNGTDLYADAPATWDDERPTDFDGYIPRHSSTNAVLMQGVKAGESPLLTVMWSISGPPVTTVALPLMLTANNLLPEKTVMADNRSWLCEKGQALKVIIFPYQENATKQIDLSKLYNREETGILQRIVRIEGEIIDRGYSVIENARQSGTVSEESLADYYAWLDKYIEQEYEFNFDAMITGIQDLGWSTRLHVGCWDISGKRQSNPQSYRGVMIRHRQKYLNH